MGYPRNREEKEGVYANVECSLLFDADRRDADERRGSSGVELFPCADLGRTFRQHLRNCQSIQRVITAFTF